MEENKLFNEIKSAAENAETNDFPGMENVWQRVEGKLDKKEDKKAIWRWKKIAVAASLLLFATLGYQFFKNNSNDNIPNNVISANDTIVKETPKNAVVTVAPVTPEIKKNADEILQKQIASGSDLAVLEESNLKEIAPEATTETFKLTGDDALSKRNDGIYNSASINNNNGYLRAPAKTEYSIPNEKDIELFIDKNGKVSNAKKEEPLVVIENKVVKRKLENIQFNQADSLVVLNEPLYIINGVEYTEQEVFGPNPTSPYTPLNKQEIETISVLQNEKAIEIYGDKGKKGVVIITTKTRKPVNASTKAK